MSRFESLGELKEVRTPAGPIRYRERGTGEPIVFVHGLLVNGDLWRNVVPALSAHYRCVTPDLPLGGHDLPMNADADLSPAGLAEILVAFLDAIGLERATLVANDTGGAVSQLVAVSHPERIERLVLTPCDCFDIFPPKLFNYLKLVARVPGGLYVLGQSARLPAMQRLPLAFGWLAKRGIDARAVSSYLEPGLRNAAVRRDTAKFCKTVSPRYTIEAAKKLPGFDRPVLLVWAREDKLFPLAYAERLARTFPDAKLVTVDDSYTFVPEDRPEELARIIADFIAARPVEAARPRVAAAGPRPVSPRA